jgi:hypothetical protein
MRPAHRDPARQYVKLSYLPASTKVDIGPTGSGQLGPRNSQAQLPRHPFLYPSFLFKR